MIVFVAGNAQDPTILDKLDLDQAIDVIGDMASIPHGIVRPDEEVEAIRQARARQQQALQAAATMKEAAGAARDLAGAEMGGDNALTRLLRQAQAGEITPAA